MTISLNNKLIQKEPKSFDGNNNQINKLFIAAASSLVCSTCAAQYSPDLHFHLKLIIDAYLCCT